MQLAHHRRPRWIHVATSGALMLAVTALGVPADAATKADDRTAIRPVDKKSEDRIAMPRRNLSPTVTARRALGATFIDRVSVAFEVRLGTKSIGRLTGLVDLNTGGADLVFLAPDDDGTIRKEPFGVRVRGERMQVSLPADLRGEAGVDGYVTTIREGTYGSVGVADEVLIPVALLTALQLPRTVSSWDLPKTKKSATPTTKPKTSAKNGGATTSVPVTAVPARVLGVATRTDFKVLSQDRFGDTADVELALRPQGQLRGITIRFTPLNIPEAKGLKPISLVGTETRSTKSLSASAPTGTFLTASKFFDLDPLPNPEVLPGSVAKSAVERGAVCWV